eukprot:g591.t1
MPEAADEKDGGGASDERAHGEPSQPADAPLPPAQGAGDAGTSTLGPGARIEAGADELDLESAGPMSGLLLMKKRLQVLNPFKKGDPWAQRYFEFRRGELCRFDNKKNARSEKSRPNASDVVVGQVIDKELEEGRAENKRPHRFNVPVQGRVLELAALSSGEKARWIREINAHVREPEIAPGADKSKPDPVVRPRDVDVPGAGGITSPTHAQEGPKKDKPKEILKEADFMKSSSGESGMWLKCKWRGGRAGQMCGRRDGWRRQYCKVRDPNSASPALVLYDGERVDSWGDRQRKVFNLADHELIPAATHAEDGRYKLVSAAGRHDEQNEQNEQSAAGDGATPTHHDVAEGDPGARGDEGQAMSGELAGGREGSDKSGVKGDKRTSAASNGHGRTILELMPEPGTKESRGMLFREWTVDVSGCCTRGSKLAKKAKTAAASATAAAFSAALSAATAVKDAPRVKRGDAATRGAAGAAAAPSMPAASSNADVEEGDDGGDGGGRGDSKDGGDGMDGGDGEESGGDDGLSQHDDQGIRGTQECVYSEFVLLRIGRSAKDGFVFGTHAVKEVDDKLSAGGHGAEAGAGAKSKAETEEAMKSKDVESEAAAQNEAAVGEKGEGHESNDKEEDDQGNCTCPSCKKRRASTAAAAAKS